MSSDERFWGQVDKGLSDGCWLWQGTVNQDNGYGYYSNKRAHRLAYEKSVGPIPTGMHLDHLCFNRLCVNPMHLRLVTQKQNNEHQQLRINNKSGVRGVHKCKKSGKWVAAVGHHGKVLYLGRYETIDEAEQVVIAKRNELFSHNDEDRRCDSV